METLLVLIAIGTGTFFAIRFHYQDRGWVWGLMYGLFLLPIALAHVLILAMIAFFSSGGFARFAKNEASYFETGIEHMMNGEYDKAISDFDRSIELNPDVPQVYEVRGRTYAIQSRYDKAISDFNRAIEIMDDEEAHIDGFNPHYHRGIAWTELNEYDRAMEDFNKAIALHPDPEAYLERGHVFSGLKKYNRALEDYEKAISLNPNADAYRYRGTAYLNLGESEKALNDFQIVIRLDQEEPAAYLGAAKAYFDNKDFKKAIVEFTQGISLLPDYMEANSGLFERLKQEKQMEVYDRAIDIMTELYRGRGLCHLNLGEYQEAIKDFDAAINLNPDDADAYQGRGASYGQFKKHNQAVEDLDFAIRLNPNSANTFFTRGIVHFNKEDYDSGIRDFDRAIALEPSHADSYTGRGRCYLHLGEYRKSISDLDTAISLEDKEGVVPDIKNTMTISLDSSYAYAIRGLVYSMLGCEAAAEKDFNKAVALGYGYSQIEENLEELKEQSERAKGNFKINPKLNTRRDDVSAQIKHPIASEETMTQELQQTVLDILTDNLRPGSSEATDQGKRSLPARAVSNATPDSLRAFLEVHEAIGDIVGPDHYRTRHAGRTSKERIGLRYVTRPMVEGKPARTEIQTLQLPLRPSLSGYIHAALSGHDQAPVNAKYVENIGTRAGKPVFLVTDRPTPKFCEELIQAFRTSSLFSDIQY